MKNNLCPILLLLGLVHCSSTMKIRYDLKDIQPGPASRLSSVRMDFSTFGDARASVPENAAQFTDGPLLKTKPKEVCINSELRYEKGTFAHQVTQALAEHLRKRATFQSVSVDERSQADYTVSASIRQFIGRQEWSNAVAVGSAFGLIGALSTSKVKTHATITIELTGIEIHRKNGSLVKKLPNQLKKYEGEVSASGQCLVVYGHVNEQLKAVATELLPQIEKAVLQDRRG